MRNRIIKRALFEADMKQYHLAGLLGIREESLSRKMREELPEEEQKRIAQLIRQHAEGKGAENDG